MFLRRPWFKPYSSSLKYVKSLTSSSHQSVQICCREEQQEKIMAIANYFALHANAKWSEESSSKSSSVFRTLASIHLNFLWISLTAYYFSNKSFVMDVWLGHIYRLLKILTFSEAKVEQIIAIAKTRSVSCLIYFESYHFDKNISLHLLISLHLIYEVYLIRSCLV